MHLCLFKKHSLSLIKKSVTERHNVIFDANMELFLAQLMCENEILAFSELPLGAPQLKTMYLEM